MSKRQAAHVWVHAEMVTRVRTRAHGLRCSSVQLVNCEVFVRGSQSHGAAAQVSESSDSLGEWRLVGRPRLLQAADEHYRSKKRAPNAFQGGVSDPPKTGARKPANNTRLQLR